MRVRFSVILAVAFAMGMQLALSFVGFGSVTRGAEGQEDFETYHVTSLENSGSGTLRDAVSQGGRKIVFDVAGTIHLESQLNIAYPYTTIDGSTAPPPGITLSTPGVRTCIEARNSVGAAHDIIVTHLRIVGDGEEKESIDILELDGSQQPVYNIVLDHITARAAGDGVFDIYGDVSNVTISNSFVNETVKMCHLSASGFVRERITFHRNVFAKNNERQIRMRHHNNLIDFVNNVVYGWGWMESGGTGLSIDHNTDVPDSEYPRINIENNYYHLAKGDPDRAILRNIDGKIFFSGNIFPTGENDTVSTSPRHEIPEYARLTALPASQLGDSVVPYAGMFAPTPEETALLQEIIDAIGGNSTRIGPGGSLRPAAGSADWRQALLPRGEGIYDALGRRETEASLRAHHVSLTKGD